MFDKGLFNSIIAKTRFDIIAKFPQYTVYNFDEVIEIELDEGTLTCRFHGDRCYEWSFYTNNEIGWDLHSFPFADLFPTSIHLSLPDGFIRIGLC